MINLPFSCIKIDRSLLWDVQKSNRTHTLIESIIAVVRNIGFRVIVEGVETAEQLAYLQSINCDMAQGFYLSPPKRAEQLFT
jgi:EAL domain-containing protein (putative c-di-GMP-specific phosphodiesterase class I)